VTYKDINECALNQDTCTAGQTCENTIGSFSCRRVMSCGTGYTLDQATQQCLGTSSGDETSMLASIPDCFKAKILASPWPLEYNVLYFIK